MTRAASKVVQIGGLGKKWVKLGINSKIFFYETTMARA